MFHCTRTPNLAWYPSNRKYFSETQIFGRGDMGLSVGSVARIYCIKTIMNLISGFSFEYFMPLGVNRCYFSLPGHCGFKLGLGFMVLGR